MVSPGGGTAGMTALLVADGCGGGSEMVVVVVAVVVVVIAMFEAEGRVRRVVDRRALIWTI
jgi:hypothetical protein